MTVIPFRGVKRSSPVPAAVPDIAQLSRAYVKAGICLYMAPWMFWLDLIRRMDDPPDGNA